MPYSPTVQLPPTDSLVAALTAARLGSFSAAALELGITHAAVSRRIAVAEDWAGERLFDRHGRGVTPTPNGQRVLARVGAALDQIATIARGRGTRRELPTVRLAVTPSFARFWLLPRLKAVEGDPADVRLEVIADLKHSDLIGGEVDLAIRYGRGGWRVGAEQKLFDELLVPVVAETLISGTLSQKATHVVKLPLLHNGDSTNWKAWIETHCPGVAPKALDRTMADYGLSFDAAVCGLGMALWNQSLHTLDGRLVAFDGLAVASTLGYYLLRRAGDTSSPAAAVAGRILGFCRSSCRVVAYERADSKGK